MKELANQIVTLVGGAENIKKMTHCATRLRLQFYDKNKVEIEKIKDIKGVVGVVDKDQFQIVIGLQVQEVYDEIIANTNLEGASEKSAEKKKWGAAFLDIVVSIFSPLLPLLAGSGILRGLVILSTQIGILSDTSSTYTILTLASTAVFHFLPVLLAITTAKKFKASPYISVAIMGALIMPGFEEMLAEGGVGSIVSFMGIPVVMVQYTSSVIPAVCAIYLQSKLEQVLHKFIPHSLHMILIPAISLFLMVPITAIVFGPFGVYVGMGIASAVEWFLGLNGWVSGALIAGIWNILIMFGIHWAVNTTVVIPNIALTGSSTIIALAAGANFGMAGACLGVWLKSKDKELRSYSISSIMSIFLSGIVEPALYGVGLKYKRPLIAGIIASALGGAVMGGMGVVGYAFVFGGITTIPAFMGPTILWYIVGLIVCFVMGTVLTMVFGFKDEKFDDEYEEVKGMQEVMVTSPIEGKIIALENVKDETFSKKMMGEGIAIIPSKGIVKAPFDCEVEFTFPTNHAIGLKNKDGVEVLIHIGLNTVELEGKYMKTLVNQKDKVKQGDTLIEFDLEQLEKLGYDVTTPVIITNGKDYHNVKVDLAMNEVDNKTSIIGVS